ncbi:MAG: hypothetical protein LBS51_01125, partial [Oscillospiraceae bacterium]|nr:hypothetical protein [Oscillospiraceae bacterium]
MIKSRNYAGILPDVRTAPLLPCTQKRPEFCETVPSHCSLSSGFYISLGPERKNLFFLLQSINQESRNAQALMAFGVLLFAIADWCAVGYNNGGRFCTHENIFGQLLSQPPV